MHWVLVPNDSVVISPQYEELRYFRSEPHSQLPIFHLCLLEPVVSSLYELWFHIILKGKFMDQATK